MPRFTVTDGRGAALACAVQITPHETAEGLTVCKISVPAGLDRLRIEWTEQMLGHVSVWHPTCGRGRGLPQFFHPQRADSCFYSGAPVLATVRADGTVHRAVSLADAAIRSSLGYYVDDFSERDTVVFSLELFDVPAGYTTALYIDRRPLPLAEALGEVWRRWERAAGKALTLPDDAFASLYSTWYSFHQMPEQTALTEELRLASALGFKTVILDDGWQIAGAGTKDYRKSGDWTVAADKFPDFGGFVREAHALGLKLLLWFAVPFAGFETEAYRRFGDKLLFREEGFIHAGTLDIRWSEVRAYVAGTYLRFIEDYDIDGLKLDFIDHFMTDRQIPPFCEGMDAPTPTQAVRLLLEELCAAARRLKPDLLMEFRQNYVGPEILRFGNMLRVGDCAFDAVTNRIGAADLRMLTRGVAVHADMLLWSPDETPENCALQLLNVLFAVPQISVRLAGIGTAQRRLLQTHLAYRERNREVLLRGRLCVRHPETGYSAIWAEDGGERRIAALYTDRIWRADGRSEDDVWNATGSETVVILNDGDRRLELTVYDCYGEPRRHITAEGPAAALTVPVGGCVKIAGT